MTEQREINRREVTRREVVSSAGLAGGEVCRDGCITCGDVAVEVTVVELLPRSLAVVALAGGTEEVSVALVDARAGDTILVHAGEAIGVVRSVP